MVGKVCFIKCPYCLNTDVYDKDSPCPMCLNKKELSVTSFHCNKCEHAETCPEAFSNDNYYDSDVFSDNFACSVINSKTLSEKEFLKYVTSRKK